MWSDRALTTPIREKLMSLVQSGGFRYDSDKRRLVPRLQNRLDTPWAFFGCSVNGRNCHLWTKIMFKHFGLVPAFCRFRCYKVVVKPRNVAELIRTYHFASAIPFIVDTLTIPIGKAGMDLRTYTDNPWSAFWYANGLSHANNIRKLIYSALKKVEMDEVAESLIIKKSCTEMEVTHGPTNGEFWQRMSEEEQLLEDRLGDIFLIEPDNGPAQPNWHINGVIESWLDHARSHGDHSGDEKYGLHAFKSLTYHEEGESDNGSKYIRT